MSKADELAFLKSHVDVSDILQLTAEECCELSQAVLKLNRSYGNGTYTPKDSKTCLNAVFEEIADVLGCLETILPIEIAVSNGTNRCEGHANIINEMRDAKRERFVERVRKHGG